MNGAGPSASTDVDYLVVGAGGMGMAFVDTLLAETDATVALVDRYDRPGGHWTLAYPFVRLHQPSAFYGVASRELGAQRLDTTGSNAGLYELASAEEILTYYDQVMRSTLLPSGRLTYLPEHTYEHPHPEGDRRHQVRSVASGTEHTITVRRRVVDATYLNITVPAMRPPPFEVDPDARIITPTALAGLDPTAEHYTVVGAGKTGIDACLWLLDHGVDADRISWVMPRDPWLLDRAHLQPGAEFLASRAAAVSARMAAVATAGSVTDLFGNLERCGALQRIHPDVEPSTYRCATVTRAEVDQLRRIENVVRLGHVRHLGRTEMALERGRVPLPPETVAVDCTADGLAWRPRRPVFDGPRLTLQAVVPCQQVASAAVVAHIEATIDGDDERRNALCPPASNPVSALDWMEMQLALDELVLRWSTEPAMREWVTGCRLFGLADPAVSASEGDVIEYVTGLIAERDRLQALLASTPE